MEKYKWKPQDIDGMEIKKVVDLEFGNWKNKKAVEKIECIDSIPGFE